jgi:hypothetical protein
MKPTDFAGVTVEEVQKLTKRELILRQPVKILI